ncbi:hypothetical protein RB653_006192 [Dictyostelium firmibasis]|uniref:Cytochrome P450 n=1 Tax=Dictyostelium firmibasis TaxID=79012 RepID=A0AAN7U2C4_9MYCE
MNFLVGLVLILTIFYFIIQKKDGKVNSNIPGPKGFPILGNLLSMKGDLHLRLQEWYKQYGPIYRIRMGNVETVVLTEYPIIREAFIGNSNSFINRFQRRSRLKINNGQNLVIVNGDIHNRLKTMVLSEMTSLRIKKYESSFIDNEIKKLFKVFDEYAKSGEPIILNNYIKMFSMNIVLCFTFGLNYSYPYGDYEKASEFIKLMVDYFNIAGQPILSDFIPSLEPLIDTSNYINTFKRIFNYTSELIRKFKIENEITNDNSNTNIEDKPILSKLLQSFEKGEISWDSVVGTCIDLQVAGSDTSANTVLFCLLELINNPNIQSKLYDNIKQAIIQKKEVEEEDQEEITISFNKYRTITPYLTMVVRETYRKYPTGTIGLPHVTSQDVELNGYKISAGTQIIQNIWATHRNEKQFQDPDSFIPERFIIDQQQSTTNSNLIHFGCGVRDCIGKSLADSEIFTMLASLINRYEFINPQPLSPLNDIGKFGITYTCPENKIIIKKRL